MNYYFLGYPSIVEDYIVIDESQLTGIADDCMNSRFQMIGLEPQTFAVSAEDGGLVYPDYYYRRGVPLFSSRVFEALQPLMAGCLVKTVFLKDAIDDSRHEYRLALPSRIEGLNAEKSEITGTAGTKEHPRYRVRKMVLNDNCSGRYHMFKLKEVMDDRIIVTERFKQAMEEWNASGAEFVQVSVS